MNTMPIVKFLLLVILLNIIRYTVPLPLEQWIVFGPLFGVMERSASYFNTDFTTMTWITSYFYNFMMWLTITAFYVLLEPRLNGHPVVKSLKVYGLAWLFFASVSAIYMNHYSHPKEFYFWNILDAAIIMPILAVANGLLHPFLFRKREP
jgi:hypothetical protein